VHGRCTAHGCTLPSEGVADDSAGGCIYHNFRRHRVSVPCSWVECAKPDKRASTAKEKEVRQANKESSGTRRKVKVYSKDFLVKLEPLRPALGDSRRLHTTCWSYRYCVVSCCMVWCVMCGMRYAVCGMRYVACRMRFVRRVVRGLCYVCMRASEHDPK